MLFDDLQWADTGTELIRFLHERGACGRAASRASEAGPALQRFLLTSPWPGR